MGRIARNIGAQTLEFTAFAINALLMTTVMMASSAQVAYAQGMEAVDPYAFQSACAGQGLWTDTALAGARKIEGIVRNLKDDPNCTGLGTTLRELVQKTNEFYANKPINDKANQLSNLPEEMRALRGLVSSSRVMQNDIFKLLMQRGIQGAVLAAEVGANPLGSVDGQNIIPLIDRVGRTSRVGLDMIDSVSKHLPKIDECLASPDYQGQLFAGMIQMTAAFVSSGPNFTQRVAEVVSNLTTRIRERKYTAITRKIKEMEFMTSVNCLVEAVSESYCTTNDTIKLFNETIAEMQIRPATNQDRIAAPNSVNRSGFVVENPFAGYYLLIHQVPTVTNWIQKVLIGNEPQTNQDAAFQTNILNDINNYLNLLKGVQGTYNINLKIIEQLDDANMKRNQIVKLIESLHQQITNATFGQGGGLNFFTQSIQDRFMPFYLLEGKAYEPDEVAGKKQGIVQTWQMYVIDGGKFAKIPGFADPASLAKNIKVNLDSLIAQATVAATKHFNNWFIVDKAALVVNSDNSPRLSVYDSLRHIYTYLENLRVKMERNNENKVVNAIAETQTRIYRVLDSYKRVENLKVGKPPLSDAKLKEIFDAYTHVVLTTFNEFNVLLQRSGYIANRMAEFVAKDYTVMLKKGTDFTPFRQELFFATGQGMIEQMIQMYGKNPADMLADMHKAARLTKNNIEVVEQLVRRPLIAEMSVQKMIADGKTPTSRSIYWDSVKRAFDDQFRGGPEIDYGRANRRGNSQMEREAPVLGFLRRKVYPVLFPFSVYDRMKANPDQYPDYTSPIPESNSPDDEFGSVKFNLTRLCIQTLAFNDWKAFIPFCNGVILYPFVHIEDKTPYANLKPAQQEMIDKIKVAYNQKAVEHMGNPDLQKRAALNHTARICAYRDWRRRSYVLWQIMRMEQNPDVPFSPQ